MLLRLASLLLNLGLVLSSQTPFGIPQGNSEEKVLITPEIDSFVQYVLEDYGSPGLSIVVVRRNDSYPNGWLIEYGSYGVAQADGSPVTPDSLFAIASNSKLFLAFSVGLLIHNETLAEERGEKLSWSTKAKGLIPEWELMDKDMERIVNFQDMLAHRTGLPRHDFSGKVRKGGVLEMISTLRYLRPSAEAREVYQYNNLMYETLSYLPTLFFNQTYESYIAENLFNPLNMTGTTYSVAVAEGSGNLAHGYQRSMRDLIAGVNGTLTPTVPYFSRPGEETIWAGAGGVITSARDLATWVAMLLSNGKHPFTNQTVVPEELVNHVAEGVSIADPKPPYPELSATTYGAGQERYTYQGHDIIEHGGSNPGFKTQVLRFPNDNLGIVVLSNDEEYGTNIHEMVKWRIADEILGLKKIDWKSRIEAKNAKSLKESLAAALPRPSDPSPPTSPFYSIDGKVFHHPTYGTLEPCFVGPKTTSASSSIRCSKVISDPVVQKIVQTPFIRNSSTKCSMDISAPAVQKIVQTPFIRNSSHADETSDSLELELVAPTIIIPVNQFFATHILLRHFSGDLFNASTIWSNREVRLKEGWSDGKDDDGDVLVGFEDRFEVEWVGPGSTTGVEEGLAFKGGFWGKGKLAKAPGGSGKESAEVWFERVM